VVVVVVVVVVHKVYNTEFNKVRKKTLSSTTF
jgi:hypothetical protein